MISVHRRVDEIPISPFLLKITFLSSMGIFMDGYVLSIYSIAILYMRNYFHLFSGTPFYVYYIAMMGSSLFIGMFFGSIVLGNLSDKYGRKKIYEYDLIITMVFLILTGISINIIEFIIFEILAGVGIGADYPISSSIQAEFSPKNKRGKFLVFNIFSWTIGGVVLLLVAIPVIMYIPVAINWRILYLTGAIIPFFVILSRRNLPESPFWLTGKGRDSEALKSSNYLGKSAGVEVNELPSVEKGNSKVKDLFSKKYLYYTIFVSVVAFPMMFPVMVYGNTLHLRLLTATQT